MFGYTTFCGGSESGPSNGQNRWMANFKGEVGRKSLKFGHSLRIWPFVGPESFLASSQQDSNWLSILGLSSFWEFSWSSECINSLLGFMGNCKWEMRCPVEATDGLNRIQFRRWSISMFALVNSAGAITRNLDRLPRAWADSSDQIQFIYKSKSKS